MGSRARTITWNQSSATWSKRSLPKADRAERFAVVGLDSRAVAFGHVQDDAYNSGPRIAPSSAEAVEEVLSEVDELTLVDADEGFFAIPVFGDVDRVVRRGCAELEEPSGGGALAGGSFGHRAGIPVVGVAYAGWVVAVEAEDVFRLELRQVFFDLRLGLFADSQSAIGSTQEVNILGSPG